jgi:hypothetical protein
MDCRANRRGAPHRREDGPVELFNLSRQPFDLARHLSQSHAGSTWKSGVIVITQNSDQPGNAGHPDADTGLRQFNTELL